MSSSSLLRRGGLAVLSLSAALSLAACNGLSPVYGPDGAAQAIKLHFADPTNPLEQIVYQDLSTHFGTTDSAAAPQVSVSVTAATRDLAQSVSGNPAAGIAGDPATGELVTATGILRITNNGQQVLTTSRQATATYTTDSQVIADNSAANAAQEQAAHALAQTLELTIMSTLAPNNAAQ